MSYNAIYSVLHMMKREFIKNNLTFIQSNLVVSEYDNFSFLRMKEHDAISSECTFILHKTSSGVQYVLRTHSTSFHRQLFQHKSKFIKSSINNNRNFGFFTCGKVFRKDDSSMHSYCFHQFDILMYTSEYNSIYDYINFIMKIIANVCNVTLHYRIRESYFPFTYPSYEVDIMYNNKYIEILGCGFEHEDILQQFNIDTNIFALGVGVERLASLIFKIENIKTLRLYNCHDK